ncbi:UDP-2,4-diacetamido-2,4,6-trideoxy-beta-L-altropyranose hydrolase [Marinobacter pelagius]|uniref:UDP-2,4-diacetamido-2,4,6-trideoxy-beta-L-altropyranose hydrolase n=1 Tax=Marinobacter pelagius TaxID=379482 RepID=A0A1I4TYU0_9GAMM|nr:UDP-2,4-diacetamido-2,4,6-trideoxy-beta-L-altropyranose hydrolase [Marinobacter pelagius]SFM81902.1 UDP-2,4-diacetamido-2,4,6-trideoxy-beta-L-altropyranose hydrolase [Marinobacter pelagius]
MLVVLRADASIEIGTGHVMRCLTLADELKRQGHQCLFICREHEGHLGELIVSKGYELYLLPASRSSKEQSSERAKNPHADWLGVSWQQDAEQTLEVLSAVEADWLVVDHYALDARWERQVVATVGQILVIDDLADRDHECSLLLDQNLGRVASDYDQRVPAHCVRLIGPEYVLLRPEFARLRQRSLKRRQQPQLKSILISLGGIDKTNVTGQVLRAIAESSLPSEIKLDIIMGAASPHLEEVRDQAQRLRFSVTVSVNVSDMAERMCEADLSIGAAGSTSWERCCLGLPAIVVVLADNQRLAAQALKEEDVAIIVDSGESVRTVLDRMMTDGSLTTSLASMARAGSELVDGMGCNRVVSELTGRSAGF